MSGKVPGIKVMFGEVQEIRVTVKVKVNKTKIGRIIQK